jgi:hypothetical protein
MNGFKWNYVFMSILVFLVVEVLFNIVFGIFSILTLGIGSLLYFIVKPAVYYFGGLLVGYSSKAETIIEPAIGAALLTIAGALFSGRSGFSIVYIIAAVIAFICAMIGAQQGEKMAA